MLIERQRGAPLASSDRSYTVRRRTTSSAFALHPLARRNLRWPRWLHRIIARHHGTRPLVAANRKQKDESRCADGLAGGLPTPRCQELVRVPDTKVSVALPHIAGMKITRDREANRPRLAQRKRTLMLNSITGTVSTNSSISPPSKISGFAASVWHTLPASASPPGDRSHAARTRSADAQRYWP
jgi:hypothetical protein